MLCNDFPSHTGNLADLVELLPPPPTGKQDAAQPTPLALYNEAVAAAMAHYGDHHVYPYAYLAGFHFRSLRFGHALRAWRDASRVIARFNYVARDDEESYKEFQGSRRSDPRQAVANCEMRSVLQASPRIW